MECERMRRESDGGRGFDRDRAGLTGSFKGGGGGGREPGVALEADFSRLSSLNRRRETTERARVRQ